MITADSTSHTVATTVVHTKGLAMDNDAERRKQYAVLHGRLKQAVDAKLAARSPAKLNDTRAGRSELPMALLDGERRAWIAAYGSPALQLVLAAESSNRRRGYGGVMSPSEVRAIGAGHYSTLGGVYKEWTAQAGRALQGTVPKMKGVLFEARIAGDAHNERFVMVDDATRAGALRAERLSDAWPLYTLVERVERENGTTTIATNRALAFLGVTETHARFLVERADWRREPSPSTPRREIRAVELAGFELGSFRPFDSQPRHEVLAELQALAVPQTVTRTIEARVHQKAELYARLQTQYGRSLREVSPGELVQGRVDRLVTTAKGDSRAVVVAADSIHLVKIGQAQQQQAKLLLGHNVQLTRTNEGLRLSPAQGVERAAGRLWAKARDEGLGR